MWVLQGNQKEKPPIFRVLAKSHTHVNFHHNRYYTRRKFSWLKQTGRMVLQSVCQAPLALPLLGGNWAPRKFPQVHILLAGSKAPQVPEAALQRHLVVFSGSRVSAQRIVALGVRTCRICWRQLISERRLRMGSPRARRQGKSGQMSERTRLPESCMSCCSREGRWISFLLEALLSQNDLFGAPNLIFLGVVIAGLEHQPKKGNRFPPQAKNRPSAGGEALCEPGARRSRSLPPGWSRWRRESLTRRAAVDAAVCFGGTNQNALRCATGGLLPLKKAKEQQDAWGG